MLSDISFVAYLALALLGLPIAHALIVGALFVIGILPGIIMCLGFMLIIMDSSVIGWILTFEQLPATFV